MRAVRRRGIVVLAFIAVHMVLVLACSINTEEIQKAVQDSIDTRNSPKTTDLYGDGMSSNSAADAAWTDPAATTSPGGTPSWSPSDCSGVRFIRYEIKNQTEEASSGNKACHYEWHITNLDDTIHIRIYRLASVLYTSIGFLHDNEWVSTGTLKPGKAIIIPGWVQVIDSEIEYPKISKLAAIIDLDQCKWVWKNKLFDVIAVETPPPCRP